MPIIGHLRKNASSYPREVALVEINHDRQEEHRADWRDSTVDLSDNLGPYRREITWKAFDEAASRFANLLISRGITKGDRVGILMMNSIEWLPMYFGVLKSGAVVVPLNFRYTAVEIEYCVDLADVEVLVFGPEFVDRLALIAPTLRKGRLLFFVGDGCPEFAEDCRQLSSLVCGEDPGIPLSDDDDAAIYFSSGTTGFPKAILHTHRSLSHSAVVEQKHHGQTHDDVFLCIPPLYHAGAKMHWFGSLITGGKAVLLRGVSPETIFRAVDEEGCTNVWLLVPWAQDILLAIERGELDPADYDLGRWRIMHIGAQPVPESLIRRWKEVFPDHLYDTNYGLSEAIGPGCVHLGVENIDHVGAIGRAGYGWQTRVVDEKMNDVEPGECGELAVKGAGVMTCYYKNPEATAEVLVDGWLLTGDVARQDADGFLWLVDRKKDVIITGGENIYPVQVESFLASHPGIKDVAVIGLPDERLGEIAVAIVEARPGVGLCEESIVDFCAGIPRYKRPRRVIFADVPRSATGKIDKPLLRTRHAASSTDQNPRQGKAFIHD
ncbi:fatty-acid--CoA ligase FadD5 [Brooklawnia cerclae]|uniref:Acyl-CoA synthetase (AMP-forming)/AMP-acid ligase II n=1 Tax=Brooklawnia cerclae TaxID=349934 RepID=A0ABX0SHS1_9ACTN|nr:acyl-CoA synthetase (AMP-forming)/AMP-acid ligase II [Brooklawnia cerclae]